MSAITYHHPTVGPKAYTARGTSGWVETFKRVHADRELALILGDRPLKVIVEAFRAQQKLTKKLIDWGAILEYLSFMCGVEEKLIPDPAGVAFWCQVIIAANAEQAAKAN